MNPFSIFKSIFVGKRHEWILSCSPEEARERLIMLVGNPKKKGSWVVPGFEGKIKEDSFFMIKNGIRSLVNGRNSFIHGLYGEIVPHPGGTKIVARFRLYGIVFLISAIWIFGAFIPILLVLTCFLGLTTCPPYQDPSQILLAIGFPFFGLSIFGIGRYFARTNEREVIAEIDDVLSRYIISKKCGEQYEKPASNTKREP